MKTKILILVLWSLIGSMTVQAQTLDRKAEKEQKRIEKEREIAALVDSKIFIFKADRAVPTGFRSVNLVTNPNFVSFSPDLIISEMPFFGRAYSAAYGGMDLGLKFHGKPSEYSVQEKTKNFVVVAKIKGENDFYTIDLTVSFNGSSSMTVVSNNRSTITYYGEISPPEKAR